MADRPCLLILSHNQDYWNKKCNDNQTVLANVCILQVAAPCSVMSYFIIVIVDAATEARMLLSLLISNKKIRTSV